MFFSVELTIQQQKKMKKHVDKIMEIQTQNGKKKSSFDPKKKE